MTQRLRRGPPGWRPDKRPLRGWAPLSGAAPCLLAIVAVASSAVAAAQAANRPGAALEQAARRAEPDIPFVFQGHSYVKTESGQISPLLDLGSDPAASPKSAARATAQPTLMSAESALWPARFPRTLMSAHDVAATKANAGARPASFNLIPWQTPIKNQGGRGTCYAFAFVAGLETAYRHKYGKIVDGKYQGPQWILSEESLIHVAKSTLLNRPQTYLFENPSSYWEGVRGVVGYPMMISVLSEQMMNYRVPEAQYSPYQPLDNPPPKSPPGLVQMADANSCPAVGTLAKTWVGAPPQLDAAGQCTKGNCATQHAVDACEYTPSHIPPAASGNARFGVSFSYQAPDGSQQPGAKTLSAEQMHDTDLLESLLLEGHEVVSEFFLRWKRGAQVNASFQSSPLWEYDAAARVDGHNMLVVGYDRSDPSPSRWYFILKNSWGGTKYYLVSYEFMQKDARGGVVILDVADPELDKPVSLARGGAWLGIWPVHRGPHSDLEGHLVIRRTFDPNVPIQPRAGTDLQLGEYEPADGSRPRVIIGYLKSDATMIFHTEPAPASVSAKSAVIYAWSFGKDPERSPAR
jgi:hypothetical protein